MINCIGLRYVPADCGRRPDGFSNLADFRWFGESFSIWSNLSLFFLSEGDPLCTQMYKNHDTKKCFVNIDLLLALRSRCMQAAAGCMHASDFRHA